jgi:two-component system sensor histidine kinase PilS (NtrC family)
MSTDILDQIFEPFYTTSHQGSGLGLYIVAQLCELNNASISARINEYNGTSFTMRMTSPATRPDLQKTP